MMKRKKDLSWTSQKQARKKYAKPELQERFMYLLRLYFQKRPIMLRRYNELRGSSRRNATIGNARLFKNYYINGTNISQSGRMGGHRGKGKSKTILSLDKFLCRKFDKDELIEGIDNLRDYEHLFDVIEGKGGPTRVAKIINATLRRDALQFYGMERFFKEMDAKIIHKQGKNELLTLKWHPSESPITMVKVIDSTSKDTYLLRVPFDMKTVKQAVAWTFNLKKDEYYPLKET